MLKILEVQEEGEKVKAIRIVLYQTSANYKKEETVDNRMTYPLPPISTVIGALHSACRYTTYHPMKVSIQGRYESMHKEPYTDYCFLNSTMDDRGILVKMKNASLLSLAYDKVASAKKSQGNSFKNNITIQVYDQMLLKEFQDLKKLSDEMQKFKNDRIKPLMEKIKRRKNSITEKKKDIDKTSQEYDTIIKREKEIKEVEKQIKERLKTYEEEQYNNPIAKFRSLTTSLKFYEILDGVKLVLHVQAEEDVMNDVMEHIYELKSIGRSEDFVDVQEVKLVDLQEGNELEEVRSSYSAYIDLELMKNKSVVLMDKLERGLVGTKYMLTRDYTVVDNQRVFNKKKVLYVSQHIIDETDAERDLYLDEGYIVNLL